MTEDDRYWGQYLLLCPSPLSGMVLLVIAVVAGSELSRSTLSLPVPVHLGQKKKLLKAVLYHGISLVHFNTDVLIC